MRRIAAGLVLVVALAGCSPPQGHEEAATDMAVAEGGYAAAPSEAPPPSLEPLRPIGRAGEAAPEAQPSQPPQVAEGPAPVLYLAYSYGLTLELPSQRVPAVMDAHVAACQSAGPRLCQLIGSHRYGDPDSNIGGTVTLRAEPAWLRAFMGGIAAQVDEAGGEIRQQTTSTEDLTRQMVDSEASLSAKLTQRDNLRALLRSRPGRLSDLLAIEQELARVQAEIDELQSYLAVMRTRVAMSTLTLEYASAPRPIGSDTFRPLRDALAGFLGVIVAGFAAIITIIAGLIPVLVVGIPIVWLLLRWRRRRGGYFFRRRAAAPPPPEA